MLVASWESFVEKLEHHPETAVALLRQLSGLVRRSQEWLMSDL